MKKTDVRILRINLFHIIKKTHFNPRNSNVKRISTLRLYLIE